MPWYNRALTLAAEEEWTPGPDDPDWRGFAAFRRAEILLLRGAPDEDSPPDYAPNGLTGMRAVAGAYQDDTLQGANAGSVVIVSGADRSFVRKCTDPGGAVIDYLGWSVAGIGDVTGDGTPDIVAGAYMDDTPQATDAGSVVVFSGADCSLVRKSWAIALGPVP